MYLLNEQELETGRRERLEAAGRGLTDSTAHSHWDSWSDVEKTTATMDYLKVAWEKPNF